MNSEEICYVSSNNDYTNSIGSPWSYFDDIRCITLCDKFDRCQDSNSIFTELNIPVNFYIADYDKQGGEAGCYDSHIKVINESYEKGARCCVIFEDDIEKTSSYSTDIVNEIISFIDNTKNWDLIFLGSYPKIGWNKSKQVTDNIYKVKCALAHSYIVSRSYMEKIRHSKYIGVPIDDIYQYARSYAVLPSLFIQKSNDSCVQKDKANASSGFKNVWGTCVEYYTIYCGVPSELIFVVLGISFFALLALYILNPEYKYPLLLLLFAFIIVAVVIAASFINDKNE